METKGALPSISTTDSRELVRHGRAFAERWCGDKVFGNFADAVDSMSEIIERLTNERDELLEMAHRAAVLRVIE